MQYLAPRCMRHAQYSESQNAYAMLSPLSGRRHTTAIKSFECSQTAFMVAWNVCNRRQVNNDEKVHSIPAQHVRPQAVAVVAVV